MNDLIAKKERFQKWMKLGGVAAVALIVSPIIYLFLQGIIGLAIAAVVGVVTVNLLPVISLKLSNWKYRALDAEHISNQKKIVAAATENPIETLRKVLLDSEISFNKFRSHVEDAVTARSQFEKKLEGFAKKYPARSPEFKEQLSRIVAVVEKKKLALLAAERALQDGHLKLDEMKAYWDISQEVQKMNETAGMNSEALYEDLKVSTAVDSVFQSLSRTFAEVEVASSLDSAKMIENSPTGTVLSINIKDEVKV